MSVWFVCPSKRPRADSTLQAWRDRGYKVAVLREPKDGEADADVVMPVTHYLGWACSVNFLAKWVFTEFPDVLWIVTGGDDYLPDPNHTPEEIAEECCAHFAEVTLSRIGTPADRGYTFGVMQPTGDRWGEMPKHPRPEMRTALIDRICGSPWLGREFCRRINQGVGPLWPEYHHMYADEELKHVAEKLGVLWQRRDLVQQHNHWGRPRGMKEDMPAWAAAINSPEEWNTSGALFRRRQAAGFPGSEPL